MKIVIVGGTGLIGANVVTMLRDRGDNAVPAAPKTGVNTITGEGLADVLAGADVVIDVSNSPSSDDEAVLKFFTTSTRNILGADATAGVRHHVALSIVGVDRLAASGSGYHRAKLVQEELIRSSNIPYSIVRATPFFEFLKGIADSATGAGKVRLAPVMIQPISAEAVARTVVNVAVGTPVNGIVEMAGPEPFRLDELVRLALRATKDSRVVVTDPHAPYFGAAVSERSLLPADDARLVGATFQAWQQQHATIGRPTAEHSTPR
jgi:uncharacterized protein YbjT (DUF2867 family)